MKASELIDALQYLIILHGDLNVQHDLDVGDDIVDVNHAEIYEDKILLS